MTEADLQDFFAPVGEVTCRRMFSGYGIYLGTACFALSARGGLWIKTEPAMEPALEAAGARPFAMTTPEGETKTMRAFWSLPDAALDDADELMRWCAPAIAAARRAAAAKTEALRRMRARAGAAD